MPNFSNASKSKLLTTDVKLQQLFNEVIKHVDCTVLEGHRNQERQDQLFRQGKTKAKYPKSKHNSYPSKAIDVVPYPIDWNDKQRFEVFASFVKGLAIGMGINIRWGGDFKSFYDAPHFELVRG